MMKKISIIVPVYKVEQYLNQCVKSIVNQTYRNLEIILVDDGSPDNCGAICDAWAERDNRIKVIHKDNGGGAQARNIGLNMALGDYIGFTDSDDFLLPTMYEKLLEVMEETSCDIAECGYMEVDSDEIPAVEAQTGNISVLNTTEALRENLNDRICRQVVWNKLYRKETIGAVRFVEGKFIDDEFFTYRVLENGKHIAVLDDKLYCYRQQAGSAMHQAYSLKRLDGLEARFFRMQSLQKYDELAVLSRQNLMTDCLWHYQSISRLLNGPEKESALAYVRSVMKDTPPVPLNGLTGKITHRLWVVMFRMMPDLTVKARNWLGIGL